MFKYKEEEIKVLIIEDNKIQSLFINQLLKDGGFKTQIIEDGLEAFNYLCNPDIVPDIVLVDYHLPNMNGVEIIKNAVEKGFNYAFIFITVNKSIETVVEAMREGALDFIQKGQYLINELSPKIRKVYEIHRNSIEKKEIEQKLIESEYLFKQISESAYDAIILINNNGNIIYWNSAAESIFGFSKKEAEGRNLHNLIVPKRFYKYYKPAFRKFSKTGKGKVVGKPVELIGLNKENEEIPVELSLSALTIKGKWNALGIVRDIRKRKKNEKELQRLYRVQNLLSSANSTVAKATNENKLLSDICDITVSIGGYKLAWIGYKQYDKNKTVKPIAHKGLGIDYITKLIVRWGDDKYGNGPTGMCIKTGQEKIQRNINNKTENYPWKDDAIKYSFVTSIAFPIIIENNVIGAINVYSSEKDVFNKKEINLLNQLTENLSFGIWSLRNKEQKKIAQESLIISEEKYRLLVENANELISVIDLKGKIKFVNNAIIKTFNIKPNDIINKPISNLFPEKFISIHKKIINKIIETGEGDLNEINIKLNNINRWFRTSTQPIKDNENKLTSLLSISSDITAEREIENRIINTIIKTQEIERERFAKDIHDGLGPMLSTIKLYVGLLNEDLDEHEKNDYIKHINDLIDDVVNDIREIANGLMPRIIKHYGLVKSVKSICNRINQANKINIDLKSNIDFRFDSNLEINVFRIISELINNTLKHAKAQNIHISFFFKKNILDIQYKDDGIGFDLNKVLSDKNKGFGIDNILGRIKLLNSNYTINTNFNHGMKINIMIEI